MAFFRLTFLFIAIVTVFACKNDGLSDYKIENTTFVSTVNSELIFQQQLNQELQKNTNDNHLVNLGLKRTRNLDNYLSELKSLTLAADWQTVTLSDQQKNKIEQLQKSTSDYKINLFSMLVETDQNMIGYHVKAINPEGLKNADVRIWAENKLSYLQQNLRETQELKP